MGVEKLVALTGLILNLFTSCKLFEGGPGGELITWRELCSPPVVGFRPQMKIVFVKHVVKWQEMSHSNMLFAWYVDGKTLDYNISHFNSQKNNEAGKDQEEHQRIAAQRDKFSGKKSDPLRGVQMSAFCTALSDKVVFGISNSLKTGTLISALL